MLEQGDDASIAGAIVQAICGANPAQGHTILTAYLPQSNTFKVSPVAQQALQGTHVLQGGKLNFYIYRWANIQKLLHLYESLTSVLSGPRTPMLDNILDIEQQKKRGI